MRARSWMERVPLLAVGLVVLAATNVGYGQPAEFEPQTPPALSAGPQWFRGNTHTHTWWSDGDAPPEVVTAWYKEHGYQFLVLSDHNILSQGQRWIEPKGARLQAGRMYERAFGPQWVEKRPGKTDGLVEYRCKPLNEFRSLFEEPGRFLIIQGEEITDQWQGLPVHVNGINLLEMIPPPGGASVLETLQNNIDAVLAQRQQTGQAMFPHVNHPNFKWALQAEDIARLRGEQFYEVYNGHPGCANRGDDQHLSTERMWDVILAKRLAELGLPLMYGVATDDAHNYTDWGIGRANPGRGWVMVRARTLTPESIVAGMERGDFYATTGVMLEDICFADDLISISIRARPGVSYRTQFIGTLAGYDRAVVNAASTPTAGLKPQYSQEIGRVLAEIEGTSAFYKLTGQELYVRAKITSTAKHPNPAVEGDVEVAWVQPVRPRTQAVAK